MNKKRNFKKAIIVFCLVTWIPMFTVGCPAAAIIPYIPMILQAVSVGANMVAQNRANSERQEAWREGKPYTPSSATNTWSSIGQFASIGSQAASMYNYINPPQQNTGSTQVQPTAQTQQQDLQQTAEFNQGNTAQASGGASAGAGVGGNLGGSAGLSSATKIAQQGTQAAQEFNQSNQQSGTSPTQQNQSSGGAYSGAQFTAETKNGWMYDPNQGWVGKNLGVEKNYPMPNWTPPQVDSNGNVAGLTKLRKGSFTYNEWKYNPALGWYGSSGTKPSWIPATNSKGEVIFKENKF